MIPGLEENLKKAEKSMKEADLLTTVSAKKESEQREAVYKVLEAIYYQNKALVAQNDRIIEQNDLTNSYLSGLEKLR